MKLIMENWRRYVNEQTRQDCASYEKWDETQQKCVDRFEPLQAAPDPIECTKLENMYIGCSKEGSAQYPRQFFPYGWKHRVEQLQQARSESPITSEIFGNITTLIDWKLLQLHRFMMTNYGPTGSDVRQVPQAIIGKISQWTRRIARLDPMWQYAKQENKEEAKEAIHTAAEEIIRDIEELTDQASRTSWGAY